MHVCCTQICQVVWKLCEEMYLHPTYRVKVTELNFMKLVLAGQHVLGNIPTEFHEIRACWATCFREYPY